MSEGDYSSHRSIAHTTEAERRTLAYALLEQMGGTRDEVEAMHVDAYQAVLDEVAYRIGQVHSTHRLFHEDWNEVALWLRDGAPMDKVKPERYTRPMADPEVPKPFTITDERNDDISVGVVLDMMSLVSLPRDVSAEEVKGWDQPTRRDVCEYVGAVHLVASDNHGVRIPPMPQVLAP